VRKEQDADALSAAASERLTPVFLDVTDGAAIASAAETVTQTVTGHGLAGLVNNAGVSVGGPLESVPVAELRRLLEINVVGQIAVTQAFLPLLRTGKGRVVNMSSISGRVALPFFGPYAASKHALEALSHSLRRELRPWRIHVAIIEPGNVATPIWEKSIAHSKEMFDNMPAEAKRLYGQTIAGVENAVEKAIQNAIPAERVARAVARALTAKRPKARYLVGADARFLALFSELLPVRLADLIVARMTGSPRRGEGP